MSRPRTSKPSAFKVEYDLDQIDKSLSALIGKVRRLPTQTPSFSLILNEGIVDTLYAAGLADVGSHVEKKAGHFFTLTIDGLEFTYSLEPYGLREYFKPNTVIIIFHPSVEKKGKKTMYIGYRDGETDDLFRQIVKAVTGKALNAYQAPAKALVALNTISRSIPSRETAANAVFTTPNLTRTLGSYITKLNTANGNRFSRTLRNLKSKYAATRKNTNRILEKIRETNNA
jgi:hypothetical protein